MLYKLKMLVRILGWLVYLASLGWLVLLNVVFIRNGLWLIALIGVNLLVFNICLVYSYVSRIGRG